MASILKKTEVDPGIAFCQICHIFGNEELFVVKIIAPHIKSSLEDVYLCPDCIKQMNVEINHCQKLLGLERA